LCYLVYARCLCVIIISVCASANRIVCIQSSVRSCRCRHPTIPLPGFFMHNQPPPHVNNTPPPAMPSPLIQSLAAACSAAVTAPLSSSLTKLYASTAVTVQIPPLPTPNLPVFLLSYSPLSFQTLFLPPSLPSFFFCRLRHSSHVQYSGRTLNPEP
jgi:hypothetical protein